jgi:hypothetical protein
VDQYYGLSTIEQQIAKGISINVDFNDNNIIGIYLEGASIWAATGVQTPVQYGDSFGEVLKAYIKFSSPTATTNGMPYLDLPKLSSGDYTSAVADITIEEPLYRKDGFEIPAFSYQAQISDSNGFVFADDFFEFYEVDTDLAIDDQYNKEQKMCYVWVESSNEINQFTTLTLPSKTMYFDDVGSVYLRKYNKTIAIYKDSGMLTFDVFNWTGNSSSYNATNLQGKNIAIYAVQYGELIDDSVNVETPCPIVKSKFLFGINNFKNSATSNFNIIINNWKV